MSEYVYFAQAEDGGPIKIGTATSVTGRLASLQTGTPKKLVILAALAGGFEVERALHQLFARHRERGEWFRPVPSIFAMVASIQLEMEEIERETRRERARRERLEIEARKVTPEPIPFLMNPKRPLDATLAMNVDDAAKAIGVSSSGIVSRLKAGELRGSKIGGRWVIQTAELKRWIEAQGKAKP